MITRIRQSGLSDYVVRVCVEFSLAVILLAILMAQAAAQTASRPDRGVRPVGSYSVSDIENISLTNGNVNLSIPLAGLPPMAGGGLSWMLRAEYSSKLWDKPGVEVYQAPPLSNYTASSLQLGDGGGWRIGGRYNITISVNATMRYYSFDGSYLWAKNDVRSQPGFARANHSKEDHARRRSARRLELHRRPHHRPGDRPRRRGYDRDFLLSRPGFGGDRRRLRRQRRLGSPPARC